MESVVIKSFKRINPRFPAALLLILPLLLGACAAGVETWERDLHAEPEMLMEYDPVDLALDEHIYFSKEASSGGQGFGGGGCGCN